MQIIFKCSYVNEHQLLKYINWSSITICFDKILFEYFKHVKY
jgi:hypothetical protein